MLLVLVESPYAGDVQLNELYARAALRDCLERGEAPFASHLLYTQPRVLDDQVPEERARGIEAGLAWGAKADKTVVYIDRGISPGMRQGIERAKREGRPVEYRTLPCWALVRDLQTAADAMRAEGDPFAGMVEVP
jgi:hypothetical protein